jgi:hypothetical protein
LSRQGFALIALHDPILPQWITLTADQSMDWIAPQMVVVIEIFIAKYQTINALAEQLLDTVLYYRAGCGSRRNNRLNPTISHYGAQIRAK